MASSPLTASSTMALLLLLFLLLLTTFSSLHLPTVSGFEFQVGEIEGWVVPHANATSLYNHWASEKRFQIGDSLRFRYRKDSVMAVDEADYKECNSTHPIFFSNTGNTVYQLDESGPYYFISGVAEHCHKGQKMIVKVMTPEVSSSRSGTTSSSASTASTLFFGASKLMVFNFVLSFVAAAYLF